MIPADAIIVTEDDSIRELFFVDEASFDWQQGRQYNEPCERLIEKLVTNSKQTKQERPKKRSSLDRRLED